jgi:pimeloyl-ACP methyl ester carboxylesterase
VRAILVVRPSQNTDMSERRLDMTSVDVNHTTLYYELRGNGPSVMFVSGATGDAGHWTAVAEELSDTFTVLTYDRRANSRSPRPQNWTAAPIDEQADDAAQLLRALDLAPAVAYGNSSGASIVTSVLLRQPEVLRAAILHEPPFAEATPVGNQFNAELGQTVTEGMEQGGPPAAMESFLRFVVGNDVFESLDPDLRDRMLGNGEVFFSLELEAVRSYLPTPEQLGEVRVPCVVAAGVDNRDPTGSLHWFYESSQWVAGHLGAQFIETPGMHVPQASHPAALVEVLRPLLGKLTAQRLETRSAFGVSPDGRRSRQGTGSG